MSILLTTLNSKFIHTNLAIRYLKKYVEDIADVELLEFTINQTAEEIARKIFIKNPSLIGFSTYIWNLKQTLEVCKRLKTINPDVRILLGGPEVSFDSKELMQENKFIDYIICDEGEEAFKELVLGLNPKNIQNLVYREDGNIIKNKTRKPIENLDLIPSPYLNSKEDFTGKIVYYEASRGCPFNCSFCLSSGRKVRYFSLERIYQDIDYLVKRKVKQIKFIDRTFNANKNFARKILDYIIALDPDEVNFHFEITARLFETEDIEYFKTVKEGLFQFEIGMQSTNEKTLKEIDRNENYEKVKEISLKIKELGNIHQHLDLIIGLPYEDYESFSKSFDDLYNIHPDKLQLGFLKLLKGSKLRFEEKKHGYIYIDDPPYEILYNNYISYKDIVKLKFIEEVVEKYYNEGYFKNSIDFVIKTKFHSPFKFFEDFSRYLFEINFFDSSHSRKSLYYYMNNYFKDEEQLNDSYEILVELLKFDFLNSNVDKNIPEYMNTCPKIRFDEIHNLLKEKNVIKQLIFHDENLSTKEIIKDVVIYKFKYNISELLNQPPLSVSSDERIILFEYNNKGIVNRTNVIDITNIYKEMDKWI
ncbi:MAG: B12-binding domain-containing radical SAM protein [Tissierellales bacterium]|nr:B12-binding domain-containing radical SAM protein [Tissierellales bacterium]